MKKKQKNYHRSALSMIRKIFPKVEEIREAREAVLISVSSRDASRAVPKDPRRCALARACRHGGVADGALIGLAYSWLIKGKVATRYKTSPGVAREITSFDRHHDFEPGKDYRLSPVSPANRLGKIHGGRGSGGNGSSRKTQQVHHRTLRVREAALHG